MTTPDIHLKNAIQRELSGDRAHALYSYRAAATGFRNAVATAKDTVEAKSLGLKEAKARDGITACSAPLSTRYDHPAKGKVKVCDSAESAVLTALERTRSGEAVRVVGTKVVPGRAKDVARPVGDEKNYALEAHKFEGNKPGGGKSIECIHCGYQEGAGLHPKKTKDTVRPVGDGFHAEVDKLKAKALKLKHGPEFDKITKKIEELENKHFGKDTVRPVSDAVEAPSALKNLAAEWLKLSLEYDEDKVQNSEKLLASYDRKLSALERKIENSGWELITYGPSSGKLMKADAKDSVRPVGGG